MTRAVSARSVLVTVMEVISEQQLQLREQAATFGLGAPRYAASGHPTINTVSE